jgi:hypothetical protein
MPLDPLRLWCELDAARATFRRYFWGVYSIGMGLSLTFALTRCDFSSDLRGQPFNVQEQRSGRHPDDQHPRNIKAPARRAGENPR